MILHLVTDRHRLCGPIADFERQRRCLVAQAQHAIEADIEVLQIRERDLETSPLAGLVSDLVGLARGTRTRVVVNDRLDVALACGAAGVHLRSDSVSTAAARSIAPPGFLVGRSVHTVDEAVASARDVDYLIAGTVWPSPSKSAGHPELGAAGLARIVRAVDVPVVAIGGVTISRLSELVASGAAGLAAIGLFMDSDAGGAEGCRAIPLVERARAARAAFDTSG